MKIRGRYLGGDDHSHPSRLNIPNIQSSIVSISMGGFNAFVLTERFELFVNALGTWELVNVSQLLNGSPLVDIYFSTDILIVQGVGKFNS